VVLRLAVTPALDDDVLKAVYGGDSHKYTNSTKNDDSKEEHSKNANTGQAAASPQQQNLVVQVPILSKTVRPHELFGRVDVARLSPWQQFHVAPKQRTRDGHPTVTEQVARAAAAAGAAGAGKSEKHRRHHHHHQQQQQPRNDWVLEWTEQWASLVVAMTGADAGGDSAGATAATDNNSAATAKAAVAASVQARTKASRHRAVQRCCFS
jgi:hypothetical protein